MKAVVYNGPWNVAVKEVPDAKIERPTDALVKITRTNICGSDLHMYEGRTSVEPGKIFGHENLGQVAEVGDAVDRIKKADRVCLPFNISCGFCKNCERGLTAFCLTTNPGNAGAAYGYADMGPYQGGQAEYLRVPYADFNCLRLPPDAEEKEADYVMLADIFPTGYHATELADIRPGESVVVYGAGPVGLMAAYSAIIRGARKVMVVDRHLDRLRLAEKVGAIAIDDSRDSPVDRVLEMTNGQGADKGC
jgi:threonine dehydrogenase-like Zn-dependent dehydrogenase